MYRAQALHGVLRAAVTFLRPHQRLHPHQARAARRQRAPSAEISLGTASPVRLADGCTGLLAAAIADKAGSPSAGFLTSYAAAHLDRGLVPAFTLAARGWRQSVQWRKIPAALEAVRTLAATWTVPPMMMTQPSRRPGSGKASLGLSRYWVLTRTRCSG